MVEVTHNTTTRLMLVCNTIGSDPHRLEYAEIYNKLGRFVLALCIVVGWIMGMTVKLSPLIESIIFAFISGAMILIVLKYELPPDDDAHFPTFAFGVVAYTTLTMSMEFFFQW